MSSARKPCTYCGYPQHGTRQEQIEYNTKLLKVKDLVEESDRSIKSLFSLAIIFFFMAVVVLAFSLIFNERHYSVFLLFVIAGKVYYLLSHLGKRSPYLMVVMATVFYMLHTIFEFSYGIFPPSPVNAEESFIVSKGASIVFAIIPIAYVLIRFALMLVLLKFLFIEIKLKASGKMTTFVRGNG
jgi:hypothetical protein